MTENDTLQNWFAFNRETVAALLSDGSNPENLHTIEYHFASKQFQRLEKAAVDLFKTEFEVTDAEELQLDDGSIIYSFDATKDRLLDITKIDQDTEVLLSIAEKYGIVYDGWGTYFVE